jgi:hypothetical protein
MVGAVLALAANAWAQDTQTCIDASERSLSLRKAGKFHEALRQLRACASQSCLAEIRDVCEQRISEIAGAMPSVVLSARNREGKELTNVRVDVDGQLLVEHLDGVAVSVDPGTHSFQFDYPDGTRSEQRIVLHEGEKARAIAATLEPTAAPARAGVPGPAVAPSDATSREVSSGPWKAVGLVTLAAGAVGLGVGAVFGIEAIIKKNAATSCDSQSVCQTKTDQQTLIDGKNAGDQATVFDVAGGVLAAAGVTILLLAPSPRVQVAPAVGSRGAGLQLYSVW